MKKIRT